MLMQHRMQRQKGECMRTKISTPDKRFQPPLPVFLRLTPSINPFPRQTGSSTGWLTSSGRFCTSRPSPSIWSGRSTTPLRWGLNEPLCLASYWLSIGTSLAGAILVGLYSPFLAFTRFTASSLTRRTNCGRFSPPPPRLPWTVRVCSAASEQSVQGGRGIVALFFFFFLKGKSNNLLCV